MNPVGFPDMREGLIGNLARLADRDYQVRVWVNREFPFDGYYDDFSEVYEALEDCGMIEDPEGIIGAVLKDASEAAAIAKLAAALGALFTRYGYGLSDSEYLACGEWEGVLRASSEAHDLLTGRALG
ncbi:hypothetical protein [Kitasatospora sp. NPDC088351]|uniref:SCO4402 family protein n=1 Tax=Kitasatospora sp. NPDC088351 TaxID=3155180 RepID=UPI003431EF87